MLRISWVTVTRRIFHLPSGECPVSIRECIAKRTRTNFRQVRFDISGFVKHPKTVQSIKINSKVDEGVWNELKALASEMHQNLSGLLTEAIRDYVQRKRVRPVVLNPHFSPVGADIAQQICFHKGFSDRAEYQCVFLGKENPLWEQRSSEIVSIW